MTLRVLVFTFLFATCANATDWARAMLIATPGAQFTCGDTYASIRRLDGGQVPSEAALIEAAKGETPGEAAARELKEKQDAAFADFAAAVRAQLGVTVVSPEQVLGLADQLIPIARQKRAAATSDAERLATLESQVELLTQFVVFLSRAKK